MDCIAAESAITALRFEFSRQYAVTELEKKFQNDIMHNILNGRYTRSENFRRIRPCLEWTSMEATG